MRIWGDILTVAIPLAPLAVVFLYALRGTSEQKLQPVLVATGISAMAAIGVAVLLGRSGPAMFSGVEFLRWLDFSPHLRLDATFGLQMHGLSAVLLSQALLMTVLLLWGSGSSTSPRNATPQLPAILALHVFAATMVWLATNLLELVCFWQLTGFTAALLMGVRYHQYRSVTAARTLYLLGRFGDLLMLVGVAFVWIEFQSLNPNVMATDADRLEMLSAHNPAAVAMSCLCFFAGVLGRCAQFPLFGWMSDADSAPTLVPAVLQSATLLPAGLYIMIRLWPWLDAAPRAAETIAWVGALTTVLAAAAAAAAVDGRQVLSYSSAAFYGMLFAGLGGGTGLAIAAIVMACLAHGPAKAALYLSIAGEDAQRKRVSTSESASTNQWIVLMAVVVLATSFWGHRALFTAIEARAASPRVANAASEDAEESNVANAPSAPTGHGVMWLTVMGVSLHAFALVRAALLGYFSGRQSSDGDPAAARWGQTATIAATAAVLAILVGPIAGGPLHVLERYLQQTWDGAPLPTPWPLFGGGIELLPILTACVIAWMLFVPSRPSPAAWSQGTAFWIRLSRNRFYIDAIRSLAVTLPIRGAAQVCRFADWLIVETVVMIIPPQLPRLWVRTMKPLRNGQFPFYGLAVMLSLAAVLAVFLIWPDVSDSLQSWQMRFSQWQIRG